MPIPVKNWCIPHAIEVRSTLQLMKSRIILLLFVSVVLVIGQVKHTQAASKTVIRLFLGFGVGADYSRRDAEEKIAKRFNATHTDIELKLDFGGDSLQPSDYFDTYIAANYAPDIVGPIGISNYTKYQHLWLDLRPYVNKSGFDLKQFPENIVKLHEQNGELLSLPFIVYPGVMYYNVNLFVQAHLSYPPTKFGDKYMLDGKAVDWNWDTVAEIAKRLTKDANGKTASDSQFDPAQTIQYGFVHQWATMRSEFSTFGAASVVDPKTGKVVIPDHWRAKAQWVWNGLWKDHFIPPTAVTDSDPFKPSAFASGKVAMARSMAWYTCCLAEATFKWDIAPVPMYDGKYYAPADADSFHILKASKNPDAAFTVLQYLLVDAAPELMTLYQAAPARSDLMEAYLKPLAIKFPTVKNWAIMSDSLAYAAIPHQGAYFPGNATTANNYLGDGALLFENFRSFLYSDQGKDMDMNLELDLLQSDLQILADEAQATSSPTPINPTSDSITIPIDDISAVTFSPIGNQIFFMDNYQSVAVLWDIATNKAIQTFTVPSPWDVKGSFSPDGKQVLILDGQDSAYLYDVATGVLRQTFVVANRLFSATFSPDGKQVRTVSSLTRGYEENSGEIRVYDLATGTYQAFPIPGTRDIENTPFSPDGKHILLQQQHGLLLFDFVKGKPIRTFRGEGLTGVFSPDGVHVLIGGSNRVVRLWDIVTGQPVQNFIGHTDAITCAAFSPDGKQILTGSRDKTVRLWDIATGNPVQTFIGHYDPLANVAFSPDGKYVLTYSQIYSRGIAMLWQVQP
jgi:multiple sugar transport system substrate-binding protein